MIIQCKSCSRKFIIKDDDIPQKGRMVKCGYCSVTWHQMPTVTKIKTVQQSKIKNQDEKINEGLSVDEIKASDGKTYKFLGSQWAELLPSGKTGLFAKKKIGQELDKLTGRKKERIVQKKKKKTIEVIDPSGGDLDQKEQLPDAYEPEEGMGFFGYIFLLIIIAFSVVGVLKTFENDLLNYFPQTENIYRLLDEQLQYVAETVKNIIVIISDLIKSY